MDSGKVEIDDANSIDEEVVRLTGVAAVRFVQAVAAGEVDPVCPWEVLVFVNAGFVRDWLVSRLGICEAEAEVPEPVLAAGEQGN